MASQPSGSRVGPMLSVVMPVYNEVDALLATVERTRAVLDGMGIPYEVVTVNDGSTDGTDALLEEAQRGWPQLVVVELTANRGHMAALTAGLREARGSWVVTIDADLQDPPELIPKMLTAAETLCVDVVFAARGDRSADSRFKSLSAGLYYRLVNKFSRSDAPPHAADFRLMSRTVVDALNRLPERNRVYRLLVPWLGYSSAVVHFKREPRVAGKTHYSFAKMLNLSIDSITGFSTAPLRAATWIGLFSLFTSIIGIAVVAVAYFMGGVAPGWPSLILVMLIFGGIQLLTIGLLGEYIARIFTEVQSRPLYDVKTVSRFEEQRPAGEQVLVLDSETPIGISSRAG